MAELSRELFEANESLTRDYDVVWRQKQNEETEKRNE